MASNEPHRALDPDFAGKGRSILLVLNQFTEAIAIAGQIEGLGHRVACAETEEIAIESVRSNRPDLVILEWPDRRGILDFLKGDVLYELLPAVVLFEGLGQQEVAVMYSHGADVVLTKPVQTAFWAELLLKF